MVNNEGLLHLIQKIYPNKAFITLHEPSFSAHELAYVEETIKSTFVSYVGRFVDEFSSEISKYTGVKYAIPVVNGTSALFLALNSVGVRENTEVITQGLSFVATSNAIKHCRGKPVFLDVCKSTLSLCPNAVRAFLEEYCEIRDDGNCWNHATGRKVVACVPVHTFGFPSDIARLANILEPMNIPIVEDAAEALGSFSQGSHVGRENLSILSFNGNKIITTGGGGMILTNDKNRAEKLKHISTTARVAGTDFYIHDELGYNLRMPNLNAAVGLGQMQNINTFLKFKRELAQEYTNWGIKSGVTVVNERPNDKANYWLNTLILSSKKERDDFIKFFKKNKVGVRPSWTPLNRLEFNHDCPAYELKNVDWLHDRIVNLPSGYSDYENNF